MSSEGSHGVLSPVIRARGEFLQSGKVLVVDDEALIRMATMQIVEDIGYRAVEAANADEAMETLKRRSDIAAVMTDINMPGSMDGLALSRTVRDRWPMIGLIITSGRFIAKAVQMPDGVQFIAKPYTPGEITAALLGCTNDLSRAKD